MAQSEQGSVTQQPKAAEEMTMDPLRIRGGIALDYNRNWISYSFGSYNCQVGPFKCDTTGGQEPCGIICCVCSTPINCCIGGCWGLLTCGNGC